MGVGLLCVGAAYAARPLAGIKRAPIRKNAPKTKPVLGAFKVLFQMGAYST
mgnify:CR=1 FL=1